MWSHTIRPSASKPTNLPPERPGQASNNLRKKDDAVSTPEEDMTKGFDVDGFSKTSKVHAYKKPLTVAKAPSFGRTTSRTGQTATSGTDSLRKDSQNKTTQPVKPTQASRTGTSARVPLTATLTLSSSKASKAGSPLKNKRPVTSPKQPVPGRRLTDTSTQDGIPSPSSENTALGSDTHTANEPGEESAKDEHSKEKNDFEDIPKAKDPPNYPGMVGLEHSVTVKDRERESLQTEIQRLQTARDAEIESLKAQIEAIKAANDHRNEETNNAFLEQKASLVSEVSNLRSKMTDLEDVHRDTREKHIQVLSLKDEEIQRLSQAAQERRREQEGKESTWSPKGEFERLHSQHKRELDEALTETSIELEKIKVERDELLLSRDKEIKEMSELVQELQEKVEKAHQADKDELKEAEKRHDLELRDKIKEYEQELRDAAINHEQALRHDASQYEQKLRDASTQYEELQGQLLQLEQDFRDAAAQHVQDMTNAREERQNVLREATQKHDQESRDAASKYQKEVEDLMLLHHEETKTTRTRNEQASEDSAAKHQQAIEALITQHKEELVVAAAGQEQAVRDAAVKYQQESQSLETKHLEELRAATDRGEQNVEALSTKHQQEILAMTVKHQEELEVFTATKVQDLGNAAAKSQQELEAIMANHKKELSNAATQIEEFRTVTQRHQQDLGDLEQELERKNIQHQQRLLEVTTKYDNELEEASAKYKKLENGSLEKEQYLREAAQKHEEDAVRLQNQLETANSNAALLETKMGDLRCKEEESGREAALKYEHELRTATLKFEEEVQNLRTIYATAVEEISALRRALEDVEQKQREAIEEELQSLRIVYATAVEEITALRRKIEDLDQKRSEAVDEVASLKASLNNLDLKRSDTVNQLSSLLGTAKHEELEQSEAALENALLRDKLELADRRFEQDQQAVSDLQRTTQDLQAQVTELSKDRDLDQTEAAVDAALFKDKLELAGLEIHLHKGTISALKNEIEKLKSRLAEDSVDRELDHDEAIVDVALLKDKLELANIQIRQAKGTVNNLQEEIETLKVQITDSAVGMDVDQNEAAVEIALLKNTLELANLESNQDKATITSLRKQIESVQSQINVTPRTGLHTTHQLRDELSMLDRQHAAQVTDIESLKADMAAESEQREQEWKKRADVWDSLASELQGMKAQLVGV